MIPSFFLLFLSPFLPSGQAFLFLLGKSTLSGYQQDSRSVRAQVSINACFGGVQVVNDWNFEYHFRSLVFNSLGSFKAPVLVIFFSYCDKTPWPRQLLKGRRLGGACDSGVQEAVARKQQVQLSSSWERRAHASVSRNGKRERGMTCSFWNLKVPLSDTLLSALPHFLNLPKYRHKPGPGIGACEPMGAFHSGRSLVLMPDAVLG